MLLRNPVLEMNSLPIYNNNMTITLATETIDEFGFIIQTAEQKLEHRRYWARSYYAFGAGSYIVCKDLCKYLPSSKRGVALSRRKEGFYWCKECERLIKCARCRCCGNPARRKSRYRDRSRDNVKRID